MWREILDEETVSFRVEVGRLGRFHDGRLHESLDNLLRAPERHVVPNMAALVSKRARAELRRRFFSSLLFLVSYRQGPLIRHPEPFDVLRPNLDSIRAT